MSSYVTLLKMWLFEGIFMHDQSMQNQNENNVFFLSLITLITFLSSLSQTQCYRGRLQPSEYVQGGRWGECRCLLTCFDLGLMLCLLRSLGKILSAIRLFFPQNVSLNQTFARCACCKPSLIICCSLRVCFSWS